MKVIYTEKNYRVVEDEDYYIDFESIIGDCFCPIAHSNICPKKLEKEKQEFINRIETDGVYGYRLEKWNSKVNHGWEHVDSCWGFVGAHETENHCIINEFKETIRRGISNAINI